MRHCTRQHGSVAGRLPERHSAENGVRGVTACVDCCKPSLSGDWGAELKKKTWLRVSTFFLRKGGKAKFMSCWKNVCQSLLKLFK